MALEPQSNNQQQPPSQQPPNAGTQNPPPAQNPPNQNPPPKADAKPKGSIYDDLGIQDPAKGASPGVWSPTWREDLATLDDGTVDDKQLALLKRYDSPKAYHKSFLAANQRIRSGEYKRVAEAPDPEKNPTEYAEWRKEAGLPEKAEQYEILPETIKVAELDPDAKAFVAKFQGLFHKNNLPPAQAKAVAEGFLQFGEEQLVAQAQADAKNFDTHDDDIRAEWGPEWRNNILMNKNHATKVFGEDVGPAIFEARLPDGRRLGDVPVFSKALNQWARSEGGDILYDASGSAAKTIDSRITEIEKIMASDMNQYLSTKGLAEEYGALIAKRDARKG